MIIDKNIDAILKKVELHTTKYICIVTSVFQIVKRFKVCPNKITPQR